MAGTTRTITIRMKGDDQASAVVKKVGNSLTAMYRGVTKVTDQTKTAGPSVTAFSRSIGSLEKVTKSAINTFLNFGNSFRLVAQGMMSVGKALSIFVTPIVFLTIKKAADVAIEFDAALVRVSKTTQLTGETIKKLGLNLRDMATKTSTSAVELAKMAEQVGQLGVRDVGAITSLVDTFNMLTIATEISSDKVAIAMGKIANAFGIDLNTEKGAKDIALLSSVINRLENELAAAAPEILTGLENLAQVGSMLDFPPSIGAGLVAALVSVGFSAEEAGTGLRNLTMKMVENVDQISQLMGATEGYGTAQEVLAKINEDSAQVLIDMVHAASQAEDSAMAMGAAFAAAGIRGGKGWTALAGGVETFDKALAVVDDEMLEGLSLWTEYQQALLSTKNQMKVLQNNVNEIALTFGDALLPVMNEIIQTVIPAIRWLAAEFKAMSPEVKKAIVIFAVLLGILGPVTLFLSQIAFGFSMVMMAVGRMAQVVMSIGAAFKFLGGILIGIPALLEGIFTAGNLLVIGAVAAIALLLMKFTGLGKWLADFFLNLGDAALGWGKNLIGTFGEGMLSGAVTILGKVLTAIGNFIARFLAGHSPPDVGPLSHIDLWGKNVFDAFLSGFMQADFGILNDVGNRIEKILSTLAEVGSIGEKAQFTFAMKARRDLAELIRIFNDTGNISQDVLDKITANLGEASDEVQTLIRYWLEYIDIQKQLADLEKRRKETLRNYEDEIDLIGASNMSAEERVDLIRQAMRERDQELKSIAEEESALEDQKDVAQEQLETQKALLDAMQHQDDLQLKLLDTLEKLSGGIGDMFDDFQFPPLDLDTSGITEGLDDAMDSFLTLEERISRMSGIWDSFIMGFKGEPLDIEGWLRDQLGDTEYELMIKTGGLEEADPELAGIVEKMQKAHDLGEQFGGIWEKITGFIDIAGQFIDDLKSGEIKIFPEGMEDNIKNIADSLGDIAQVVGPIAAFFATLKTISAIKAGGGIFTMLLNFLKMSPKVKNLILSISLAFEQLGFIGGLKVIFATIASAIGGAIEAVIAFVGGISLATLVIPLLVAAIVAGVIWIIRNWDKVKQAFENLKNLISVLPTYISMKFGELKEKIGKKIDELKTAFKQKWEEIKIAVGEKIQGIVDKVKEIPEKIKNSLKTLRDKVKAAFTAAWDKVKSTVSGAFDKIKTAVIEKVKGIWEGIKNTVGFQLISEAVSAVIETITTLWEDFKEKFGPIWEDIVLIVTTVWDRIKEAAVTKWEEIKTFITTTWDNLKTAVEERVLLLAGILGTAWEAIKTTISTKWEEIKNAIIAKWEEVKTKVSAKWEEIKTAISTKVELIKGILGTAWETIKTIVGEKIEALKTAISEKWEEIKTAVGEKIELLKGIISTAWEGIKTIIGEKLDAVKTVIYNKWIEIRNSLIERVGNAIDGVLTLRQKFIDIGTSIINGLKDGVIAAGQGLIDAVAGAVQAALDWVKKQLGIRSPSRVMMEVGVNTMKGLIQGVEGMKLDFQTTLGASFDDSIGALGIPSAPVGSIPSISSNNSSLVLHFGRDSVRSDRDIDEIATRVERVLADRAQGNMTVGSRYGDAF